MLLYIGGFGVLFFELAILFALAIYSIIILYKAGSKKKKLSNPLIFAFVLMAPVLWQLIDAVSMNGGFNRLVILIALFLIVSILGVIFAKRTHTKTAFMGYTFCWMTVLLSILVFGRYFING